MMALSAIRAPAPVARWLAGKSRGERRAAAALLVAVAGLLLWGIIWQPLVRDIEAMRIAQRVDADALLAARAMAEEAAGLTRERVATAPGDAHAGLERVLAAHDLRAGATQVEWQDGRARLVFAAVGYHTLIAALEALQRDENLRVVEAVIAARVEPGMVRAEITLAR